MDKSKELGVESVGRLLLKFSIPAVIGMLVNALYSVVDRIFVGRGVGEIALSGVGITFPISNVIMAVGMLVGIGAAAVVSIKLGEKKQEEAEKIIGHTFTLSIMLSILVTIIGLIFLNPILKALGASAETMPYAKPFATIILIGAVLQNAGFGLNPLIRAEGNPKMAMVTMLIGAVLNFIINPILIFGFKWGVVGSASATLISQAVCSIWIFAYFTKGKSLLRLKRKNMILEKKVVNEIIAIGMSPFSMQIAASLVTITFNKSLSKYGGDSAIGAFSVINSIAVLIIMPLLGINQGAQPIIGYNYGAKNIARIKRTLKYNIIATTCFSTVGFILVQLFSKQIIEIFSKDDNQFILMAAHGMRIFMLMFAFVGAQTTCANYFQAVGKAKNSMFLSLLRQVVLLIPMILILPNFMKLNGIWAAAAVSDLVSSIISYVMTASEMKKLTRIKYDKDTELENKIVI
ncbi:MATE family efflux transporter [Clostridium sp. 19966]|uniref:MATE family efflux transporter n=1 Tax=Clostridium sp. 19966 TaxID=2768166 RepID=UPI0028DDB34E|nr:MATE family efflux transporter [Clostridium sp. 19966]MDT8717177.1 MATE family efflux transporter [Clostridium sp. 19966]